MRTCPVCDVELPTRPGPGRRAVYCSTRCRMRAHRAGRLPVEMTSRDRWVRRIGKRPVAVTGRPASVTDPTTWATYAEAKASTAGDGLGFVLGDQVGGVDLDHVIDDDGNLHPAAAELLELLGPTYVEVSPSGHGLHVLGLLPEARGRVTTWRGIRVERYTERRYLTVTGNRWPGSTNHLADLTEALDRAGLGAHQP